MDEHGLVKKARIEPQDDVLSGGGLRQSSVLIPQRLKNTLFVQAACGGFFQKGRSGIEDMFIRPSGVPGTLIHNVVPNKHFTGKPGHCHASPCAVTTCDVKCVLHFFFCRQFTSWV